MRARILALVAAAACTPRTNAPDPQVCRRDRKATVVNQLAVPVDVRLAGGIVGTVAPGEQREFVMPHGDGIAATPDASDYSRFGLTRDDRKKVIVSYVCAEK